MGRARCLPPQPRRRPSPPQWAVGTVVPRPHWPARPSLPPPPHSAPPSIRRSYCAPLHLRRGAAPWRARRREVEGRRRPVARVFLVNPRPPAGGTMAQETPMSILRRDESATHARGRHCCCLVGGPGACTHFARRSKLSRHAGLGLDGNDVMAGPSRSGPTQAPIRPSAFLVTREV